MTPELLALINAIAAWAEDYDGETLLDHGHKHAEKELRVVEAFNAYKAYLFGRAVPTYVIGQSGKPHAFDPIDQPLIDATILAKERVPVA